MQTMVVRRSFYLSILLIIFVVVVFFSLLIPELSPLSNPSMKEGDVATQDILAPNGVTFNSETLTENKQEAAARAVEPVFTSPDTSLARQQLERLRATLSFITSVRGDNFASTEQKIADLAALDDIQIDRDTTIHILALSDARWQVVQQETKLVLEQVLRDTIREDHLDAVRRSVPTRVSLSLPEDQADIVVELVTPFVIPNSFYNENLTESARQQARDAVEPVTRTFVPGENVVQHGQVISALDLEALRVFGFVQSGNRWQDIASAMGLVLVFTAFFVVYLRRKPMLKAGEQDFRGLTLLVVLFMSFLLLGRLTIPGHTVIPYLYPVMAYGLLVTSLFSTELALITVLPLSFFVAYGVPNSLDLVMYYTISSYFGILALGRGQRVTSFVKAGGTIAVVGAITAATFRLMDLNADLIGLLTLTTAAVGNGIASASISIVLQFLLAQLLGITTALQLIDISRPDHPLMQFILRNAPGTYQHSLQLANLVEQAAESIGADPLLSRVGALYHDAGKALNPYFFIENQIPGNLNPHDHLTPEASAAIILQHITDGVELARKYRLPARIQDFIKEHHGTMITTYQYHKARETAVEANAVDIERYRYPGPRPRSRETALMMLADGCEARMRAERPKDEDELRVLIEDVIEKRLKMEQLKDTDLTFKDLEEITNSFIATLRGVYHPRLEYPKAITEVTQNEQSLPHSVSEEKPTQPTESTYLS
jgi:putative nucleotidyltransferase with HDIG domain